jgi:hypothetical protein
MASFTSSEIDRNIYIWQMFRDGGVALVHSETLLLQMLNELESENYTLHECKDTWSEKVTFEKNLRKALNLPAGAKGKTNLDSLNDLVGDLSFPEDSTGVVVVARHIQRLHEQEPRYLHNIADIFASAARYHMCLGQRLLLILQSDDTGLHLDVVGGFRPGWAPREGAFSRKEKKM